MPKPWEAVHSEEVTRSDEGLSLQGRKARAALKGSQIRPGPGSGRRGGSAKNGSPNLKKSL